MPCRLDHWRRGHKQICKKIHRGGGAEQYHADKKYKEAVAFAVDRGRLRELPSGEKIVYLQGRAVTETASLCRRQTSAQGEK